MLDAVTVSKAFAASARLARRPARGLAPAALAAWLASLAVLGPACGAVDFVNEIGEPQLDLGRMEADIRSNLQRDLEARSRTTSGSVASVGPVRCRQRTDLAATCRVRYGRRNRLRRLEVTVDPQTGRYRTETVR